MTSNRDVTDTFARHVRRPDDRAHRVHTRSVWIGGDSLYSYGSHFPLARVFRDLDGRARVVLINDDTWSRTTGKHKCHTQRSLDHYTSDVPTLRAPFSALTAARIVEESIRVLDWRNHTWRRRCGDQPPPGAVITTAHETRWRGGPARDVADTDLVWNADGQQVRRLGDQYVWHTRRPGPAVGWFPTEYREALFAADYDNFEAGRRSRALFLSSWDDQDTRSYFLCQLPTCDADTIEDALEALKPEPVRLAEAMGRHTSRQGDMFAIPIPGLTSSQLRHAHATITRRSTGAMLLGTNHTASEIATLPDGRQYARGCFYHAPTGRPADHARRPIGDRRQWHAVVPNTVPLLN
ncbi:hypothetical protein [Nocardia sp. CA-119907]|uniref:hypothetical protein n=1 Tax=Nocardia sp. CA-119907 TaxID=3239973 RepID=UPI003D993774